MKKRKHIYRDDEITCICNAYKYPHRLGGGSCNGSAWLASIRSIDSFDCNNCDMNNSNGCDVIDGLESLNKEYCECLAEEIRSGAMREEYGNLPLDVEAHLEKKYQSHFEEPQT